MRDGRVIEVGVGMLRKSSVNANAVAHGAASGKAGGKEVVIEGGEAEAGLAGVEDLRSVSCSPFGRDGEGEEVAYYGTESGIGSLV